MTGGIIAIVLIVLLNLAHFSQGWVQWGYRFSNDFAPFALPLVALGAQGRDGRLRLVAYVLVTLSVLDQPVGRDLGESPRMVRRRRRG